MITWGLIVVNTDSVQLQITVSMVGAGWVDSVLITDHLPELGAAERRETPLTNGEKDSK